MTSPNAGVPGCVFPSQAAETTQRGFYSEIDAGMLNVAEAAVDLEPNFFYVKDQLEEEFGMAHRMAKDKAYACLQKLASEGNAKAQRALQGFHSISGA